MFKIELDTVELNDQEFQTYLKNHAITMMVLEEDGPAGGNPLVEYTGSEQALKKLIKEHFCSGDQSVMFIEGSDDDANYKELISYITPV